VSPPIYPATWNQLGYVQVPRAIAPRNSVSRGADFTKSFGDTLWRFRASPCGVRHLVLDYAGVTGRCWSG
jgi:hypothetical protein